MLSHGSNELELARYIVMFAQHLKKMVILYSVIIRYSSTTSWDRPHTCIKTSAFATHYYRAFSSSDS